MEIGKIKTLNLLGGEKMTCQELKNHLADTWLFDEVEIHKIVRACGKYTLGNAVIACEILGITLCGNDIDIIFEPGNPLGNGVDQANH